MHTGATASRPRPVASCLDDAMQGKAATASSCMRPAVQCYRGRPPSASCMTMQSMMRPCRIAHRPVALSGGDCRRVAPPRLRMHPCRDAQDVVTLRHACQSRYGQKTTILLSAPVIASKTLKLDERDIAQGQALLDRTHVTRSVDVYLTWGPHSGTRCWRHAQHCI